VRRWAVAGKLAHFRTPGGARRYYADEIDRMIADGERPRG
jgi:predicted site-specific integrase-resolvase